MGQQLTTTVVLKDEITKTKFQYGPADKIAGEELFLIEQHDNGDCSCLLGPLCIVKVGKEDVQRIKFNNLLNNSTLLERHRNILDSILKEKLDEGSIYPTKEQNS